MQDCEKVDSAHTVVGESKRPVIILTCRPAASDFRLRLAEELTSIGHPVTYIFLKRHPVVEDMQTGDKENWSLVQLIQFFLYLKRDCPEAVVFNSTNLAFPKLSIVLKSISRVSWCFDMHDDLLYDLKGVARAMASFLQTLVVAQSDLIVHSAPSLRELFPKSHHIGNGSSLLPTDKSGADPTQILVLASLDGRFDFRLMRDAARLATNKQFVVRGRISGNNSNGVRKSLDTLLAECPNVVYSGAYTDDELPEIFSKFLVAFAPYRTDTRLTRYIDPLRMYHCLASKTGLVTTAIPAVDGMGRGVVVISSPNQLNAALSRAIENRCEAGGRTWHEVAESLSRLIDPAGVS